MHRFLEFARIAPRKDCHRPSAVAADRPELGEQLFGRVKRGPHPVISNMQGPTTISPVAISMTLPLPTHAWPATPWRFAVPGTGTLQQSFCPPPNLLRIRSFLRFLQALDWSRAATTSSQRGTVATRDIGSQVPHYIAGLLCLYQAWKGYGPDSLARDTHLLSVAGLRFTGVRKTSTSSALV